MPPELLRQTPVLEDALVAMGVTTWAMVEYEADDALGAAAAVGRGRRPGRAGGHLHAGQGPRAVRRRPAGGAARPAQGRDLRRGRRSSPSSACRPASIPDYLALVGDSADGFPGLPGLGRQERRRRSWPVYGHLEDIPPRRRPVGGARAAGRGQAVRHAAEPARSWRCCSGASPPSSATSPSAPSTTGAGPGRPSASPRSPSASALRTCWPAPRPLGWPAGRAAERRATAHPPAEVTARRPAAHERHR